MDAFFNEVKKFVMLDDASKEAFSSIMVYHEFTKGHILVKPHSVCNYIYFIEEGLTRIFYEKDGKDITDWLSMKICLRLVLLVLLTGSQTGVA